MDDTMINAPVSEDIETPIDTTPEVAPTESIKISDMVAEAPKPRMVDEHVFVAEKKARKELEKKVRELEARQAPASDYSSAAAAIAEEFDVDPSFTSKILSAAEESALKRLEETLSTKEAQKASMEKFDKAISSEFNRVIENAPEFANIANMEIIKSLALIPANHDKTVEQLIEETYGNAVTGRRTIETTKPGGGKDPEPLDYDRATKDIEYFNKVMADSKLRDQYNERMLRS